MLLLSDCRGTYRLQSGREVYTDTVQKIFQLGPVSAIGFVGNVSLAGEMLRTTFLALRQGRRARLLDAVSLMNWLPRHLRFVRKQLRAERRNGETSFLVASVIPGRDNLVPRSRVRDLMERFRLGTLAYKRRWLPAIIPRILMTTPAQEDVYLKGQARSVLYQLAPPCFEPQFVKPLMAMAIGSGEQVAGRIEAEADGVYAFEVGNALSEAMALRQAVLHSLEETEVASVGGLLPCVKVTARGVVALCQTVEIPAGGPKFQLLIDQDGRWHQKAEATGKSMRLEFPWEVSCVVPKRDVVFNDLREARRAAKTVS